MGRPSPGTPIIEHHNSIPLRFLIDQGYLRLNHRVTGIIQWSFCGRSDGSASLSVETYEAAAYLTISYKTGQGEVVRQQIKLIHQPSNLGRGKVWYFICPQTGGKCRKLYRMGRYFYSQKAFSTAIYASQAESKMMRLAKPAPPPWPKGKPKMYEGLYTKAYVKHKEAEWKHEAAFINLARFRGWI